MGLELFSRTGARKASASRRETMGPDQGWDNRNDHYRQLRKEGNFYPSIGNPAAPKND